MKLAVVGSRKWARECEHVVADYIKALPSGTVVVTGGWRSLAGSYHVVEATVGIDRLAWRTAEEAGLVTVLVSGSKTKLGHKAGLQRNPVVVDLCDALVAFWDGESRGTARTLHYARRLKKRTIVIAPNGAVFEEAHWMARVTWVLSPKG